MRLRALQGRVVGYVRDEVFLRKDNRKGEQNFNKRD